MKTSLLICDFGQSILKLIFFFDFGVRKKINNNRNLDQKSKIEFDDENREQLPVR